MDVCKASDTSRVSISRTDHRLPERVSEASERGGSLIILSPTSTFDFWPQTAKVEVGERIIREANAA